MMNELKPSCGLIRGIGDGNSWGWEDLNLVWTLFDLRVFRCVTVKTSLLIQICNTNLSNASVLKIYFFHLSHDGNSFCRCMTFSVPLQYKQKNKSEIHKKITKNWVKKLWMEITTLNDTYNVRSSRILRIHGLYQRAENSLIIFDD